MPQPYDYSLNLPNPVNAVMQGVAIRQQIDAQRQQQQRRQQMQVDLQSLQADPSPQSYANFYLRYPEMKEQLDAYRSTLAEGDKNVLLGASRELMGAIQSGRDDLIDGTFDKHIAALKESNRPDLAKQFEEAKQFYDLDPKAGQFAVRSMFQSLDPDGYKALTGGSELTAFQKNLIAAGIDPGSQQGMEMSRSFAENQSDPMVQMPTPSGGNFVGPRSEYLRQFGGAQAPVTLASPKSKAELDALPAGTTYRAPDGSVRTKGGAGSNVSGSF